MAPAIAERDFQQQVLDLARIYRWLVYHTWDSRNSAAGFPDLVLVRAPRIIFAELKVKGLLPSSAQQQWIDQLDRCNGAEVYVFYPEHLEQIAQLLSRR